MELLADQGFPKEHVVTLLAEVVCHNTKNIIYVSTNVIFQYVPLGKVDDLMTVVLAIQRHQAATAPEFELKMETSRPQLLGRPATYGEVKKNLPDNKIVAKMPEYLRTSYLELAGEAKKKVIGNASWESRQVLFFILV